MIRHVTDELQRLDKALRIQWTGVDSIPIQTANQFLVQIDAIGDRPDQLILAFGQVTPPPILGTEEEKQAQMAGVDSIKVLPLARYSMTPGRLTELIELLKRIQSVWVTSQGDAAETAGEVQQG